MQLPHGLLLLLGVTSTNLFVAACNGAKDTVLALLQLNARCGPREGTALQEAAHPAIISITVSPIGYK
jgi:hypothetical protein